MPRKTLKNLIGSKYLLLFSFLLLVFDSMASQALGAIGDAIAFLILIGFGLLLLPLFLFLINLIFKVIRVKNWVGKLYGYYFFVFGFYVLHDPFIQQEFGLSRTYDTSLMAWFRFSMYLGLFILLLIFFIEKNVSITKAEKANKKYHWPSILGSEKRPLMLTIVALGLFINIIIMILNLTQFPLYNPNYFNWVPIYLVAFVIFFYGLWMMKKWVFIPFFLFVLYSLIETFVLRIPGVDYYLFLLLSLGASFYYIWIFYLQEWQKKKGTD